MATVRLLLGGDVCPTGGHAPAFAAGDVQALWGDSLALMQQADFVAVNLECPVVANPSPIAKTGPVLSAPGHSLKGLSRAQVAAVSLANNHILDHGEQGLRQTLAACQEHKLLTFGAGTDLASARQWLMINLKGIRVAFLAMAEREWSVATQRSGGANPMDPISFVRQVQEGRGTFDFLVVLVHAGAERYPYPSPALQDFCRFLVEQGAGLVLCQHSHCLGCAETYRGGYILYGQGNLLFDSPNTTPAWHLGAWVEAELDAGLRPEVRLHFYQQSVDHTGQSRLRGRALDAEVLAFQQRSAELADGARVQGRWEEFCAQHGPEVLAEVLGHGPMLRRLTRRPGVLSWLYSAPALRNAWNSVRCETHREILLNAFDRCLSDQSMAPDSPITSKTTRSIDSQQATPAAAVDLGKPRCV
jgi:hypothetical protein